MAYHEYTNKNGKGYSARNYPGYRKPKPEEWETDMNHPHWKCMYTAESQKVAQAPDWFAVEISPMFSAIDFVRLTWYQIYSLYALVDMVRRGLATKQDVKNLLATYPKEC